MTSPADDAITRLLAAKKAGADVTIAIAPSGAAAILITPRTSADSPEFLSLDEARQLARFSSTRPLKDAGRRGELTLFGTERTRTVKRADVLTWLESRRTKPTTIRGRAGDAIDRRFRRLEATEEATASGAVGQKL